MTRSSVSDPAIQADMGPFVLSGPAVQVPNENLPLRGDLAHIALAGRYFVPHYAVPQPHTVKPGGAILRAAPADDAAVLGELSPGTVFEVLDIAGQWSWGCLGPNGLVGYVPADHLESCGP